MKKLHSMILASISAILLFGCSTPPEKVDTGTISARTFSFVDTGAKEAPGYSDNRAAIHKMIQGAITRNLATHGVTRVGTDGDITVAYLVIVGNNVSTTAISDYFGYRKDTEALHEKAQKAYTGSGNPSHFEAGTLLIDIIDGKTYKLLKRGYATRSIMVDLPADARAAQIQGVVDEILRSAKFTH